MISNVVVEKATLDECRPESCIGLRRHPLKIVALAAGHEPHREDPAGRIVLCLLDRGGWQWRTLRVCIRKRRGAAFVSGRHLGRSTDASPFSVRQRTSLASAIPRDRTLQRRVTNGPIGSKKLARTPLARAVVDGISSVLSFAFSSRMVSARSFV